MAKTSKRRKSDGIQFNIGKRIKVQAQRKFAQGAVVLPQQHAKDAIGQPIANDPIKSQTKRNDFIEQNGPKIYTEDFLTFLCFKGSSSLQQHLRAASFFQSSNVIAASTSSSNVESHRTNNIPSPPPVLPPPPPPPVQGFIPFGVRKQASQFPKKPINKRVLQPMKRKFCSQKNATRAITPVKAESLQNSRKKILTRASGKISLPISLPEKKINTSTIATRRQSYPSQLCVRKSIQTTANTNIHHLRRNVALRNRTVNVPIKNVTRRGRILEPPKRNSDLIDIKPNNKQPTKRPTKPNLKVVMKNKTKNPIVKSKAEEVSLTRSMRNNNVEKKSVPSKAVKTFVAKKSAADKFDFSSDDDEPLYKKLSSKEKNVKSLRVHLTRSKIKDKSLVGEKPPMDPIVKCARITRRNTTMRTQSLKVIAKPKSLDKGMLRNLKNSVEKIKITEDIEKGLIESLPVIDLVKSTTTKLEKSFSESDDEPLATKITELTVKTDEVIEKSTDLLPSYEESLKIFGIAASPKGTKAKNECESSPKNNNRQSRKFMKSKEYIEQWLKDSARPYTATANSQQPNNFKPITHIDFENENEEFTSNKKPDEIFLNKIDHPVSAVKEPPSAPPAESLNIYEFDSESEMMVALPRKSILSNEKTSSAFRCQSNIEEKKISDDEVKDQTDSKLENELLVRLSKREFIGNVNGNETSPRSGLTAKVDSMPMNLLRSMNRMCLEGEGSFQFFTSKQSFAEDMQRPAEVAAPHNFAQPRLKSFEKAFGRCSLSTNVKRKETVEQGFQDLQMMTTNRPINDERVNAYIPLKQITEQGNQDANKALQRLDTTAPLNVSNSHSIEHRNNVSKPNGATAASQNRQQSQKKNESEDHLFYIPLQGVSKKGVDMSNHLIEGVAVKMDTEGPNGVQQRVIMRAKLVRKSQISGRDVRRTTVRSGPMLDMVRSVREAFPNATIHGETIPSTLIGGKGFAAVNNLVVSSSKSSTCSSQSSSCSVAAGGGRVSDTIGPKNDTAFPQHGDKAQMVEAPVFQPTEKEFQDPLEFIERITPIASKYGLCRIIPPANFKPDCKISDDMRFTPHNQYLHRMLYRWGPSSRELCAIKKYLATQSVTFKQPPTLSGIEVDLPKLYHIVQNMGGLNKVLEKKMWHKVAEEMCHPVNVHYMDIRLDEIYCKYLLPYDTLSFDERKKLFESVDQEWKARLSRMMARADNPINFLANSEMEECEYDVTEDIEECITRGKSMTLGSFVKTAKNTMSMHFGKTLQPSPEEVETKFWKYVTAQDSHVCVSTGSIDSSVWGYGFPNAKTKNSPIARHPWNLKVLTNNTSSVLRSLGPIMGVTVPTIHVGMVFSTCCWYRDPHGLPWIEYLHDGAPKIWYGIPDSQTTKFKETLSSIVPSYCQKKTIWLLSDTTMVPPKMLTDHGVSLCRTIQNPGEFILVFPKAFTSSMCTGYSVSESVYFALNSWLDTAQQDFIDIRNSCEPSMFSLERLIVAISEDVRTPYQILKKVLPALNKIIQMEKQNRDILFNMGLKMSERVQNVSLSRKKTVKRQDEVDECHRCRSSLSLSMLHFDTDGSMFCLLHGAEFLSANQSQIDSCKLVYMHSIDELERILSKLIERLNTLANKKCSKMK